jgi:RNA recognition motif-containing protein
VGNLPYSVTSERLQEAFSQFGTVASSKVIVDRETGRSRGFAFLEMETDDQGAAAMQAMNGALLDGRSIAVREAVERQPGGGGGGNFGGGGGGYRGAGDGGPMRDRRADFSGGGGAPPAYDPSADAGRPQRRRDAGPHRRDRDYEPRKRGFDDDQ